jgi:hypothetical protein
LDSFSTAGGEFVAASAAGAVPAVAVSGDGVTVEGGGPVRRAWPKAQMAATPKTASEKGRFISSDDNPLKKALIDSASRPGIHIGR